MIATSAPHSSPPSTMELNPRSMTEEVATDIQRAINALPPAHQVEPQDGELVDNPRDGYIRLQDWAFTQGFALVKRVLDLNDGSCNVFIIMIRPEVPER